LKSCAPGASFKSCAAALAGAGVKARELDNDPGAVVRGKIVDLTGGLSQVVITTRKSAGDRVTSVVFGVLLKPGKPRRALLDWVKKNVEPSSVKTTRAGTHGAADHCGAKGFGVGWVGAQTPEPEVQVQLDSPEASNPRDTDPDNFPSEEEALIKPKGNGTVDVCFLLPNASDSTVDNFVAQPQVSTTLLPKFLASGFFHGKAKTQ
jgi:hypothetical protein